MSGAMFEERFIKLVEENGGFEYYQAYRNDVDHILGGKGDTYWYTIMKKGKVSALLPIGVFLILYLGLGILFEYILSDHCVDIFWEIREYIVVHTCFHVSEG